MESHPGELADLASLVAAAKQCDDVIDLAFIDDFSTYLANAEADRRALEAMAGAMEGTGKPLVVTSSTAVLKPGKIGTERDVPENEGLGSIRAAPEQVLTAAGKGVRVCAVRLPPSVHGTGNRAFIPAMIETARIAGPLSTGSTQLVCSDWPLKRRRRVASCTAWRKRVSR